MSNMDDATRIAIAVVGVLVLLVGLGTTLLVFMRGHLRLWRAYAATRGGHARMSMGLNSFAKFDLHTTLGDVHVDEWRAAQAGQTHHGQWLATLRLRRGRSVPAFLLGDDAWAAKFAPWARRLPPCDGLGPDAPVPLDRGRCEMATLRWWNRRTRQLAYELGVYLSFGRGDIVRVHVPGGLTGPADFPRLDQTIELLGEIAESAGAIGSPRTSPDS